MTIRKVSPGQPWQPSASKENRWNRAASAVLDGESAGRDARWPPFSWDHTGSLLVRNLGNQNIRRFGVIRLDDPTFKPVGDDNKGDSHHFLQTRQMDGDTPNTWGRFGIAMQPIGPGNSGVVTLNGIVPVRVKRENIAHNYARPIPGDVDRLETAGSGHVRMYYMHSDPIPGFNQFDDTYWALVQLQQERIISGPAVLTSELQGGSISAMYATTADVYALGDSGDMELYQQNAEVFGWCSVGDDPVPVGASVHVSMHVDGRLYIDAICPVGDDCCELVEEPDVVRQFTQERTVLSATDISNGYITIAGSGPDPVDLNQLFVVNCSQHVPLCPQDDYTYDPINLRIIFQGPLVHALGEIMSVRYLITVPA